MNTTFAYHARDKAEADREIMAAPIDPNLRNIGIVALRAAKIPDDQSVIIEIASVTHDGSCKVSVSVRGSAPLAV